ncbi:MAG: hypothetical protein KDA17_05185 [Candidatus Saccharibacteria bacterium]|nr:hypothetical protein [Candidatus Saccharibacteria bacterium]
MTDTAKTKICSKCGVSKPTADFMADRSRRDGLRYHCKQCNRERYAANKEKILEQQREYYTANREKINARNRAYAQTPKGKERKYASVSKWQASNPEKTHAQIILKDAVRSGKVLRQPCIICGNPKTHGHHVAYDLPFAVSWVCRQHHIDTHALHKELKK